MSEKEEKTEAATPKKREDARKEGNVLKSQDVTSAITTIAMFAALSVFAGIIGGQMIEMVKMFFTTQMTQPLIMDGAHVNSLFSSALGSIVSMMLPLAAVALVAGLLSNFIQVKRIWTLKPLKPNFKKFNPIKGLKKIISPRALIQLVKSLIKLAAIAFVVYGDYVNMLDVFPQLMYSKTVEGLQVLLDSTVSMAFKVCIALVAVAVGDYAYERYTYEKNLKMTKQEVKDEYKNQEGDPKIKGAIKRRQMEMSMKRMMQNVSKADVVITNPTHYAVAVQYDDKIASAPIVVAKGKDLVAQKIKEKAREHGVRCVENKPVAQALYAAVEVGQTIPEDMFKAVAEILAYVYSLKNRQNVRRRPSGTRPGGHSQRPRGGAPRPPM